MSYDNHDKDDPNRVRYVREQPKKLKPVESEAMSLLELMKSFEKRNNISISIDICSDGSGIIREFWDKEELNSFKSYSELEAYLKNTQYKLDEKDGRCLSPVQIIN